MLATQAQLNALCANGKALADQLRYQEAAECFAEASKIAPKDPHIQMDEAIARLGSGDLAVGFKKYEARFEKWFRAVRFPDWPHWMGQSLNGKRILLHHEQGFGDTIQFSRYIPRVAKMAKEVTLFVLPEMAGLMRRSFPNIDVQTKIGEGNPNYHHHCPLMSLAHVFGTTLETVPPDIPYLRAPKRKRIERTAGKLIGLVWRGGPMHRSDNLRSVPAERILSLTRPGFVSLQFDPKPAEIEAIARSGIPTLPPLKNFSEAAAAIAQLDLLITVDTAYAHLAGALGIPVWILLPYIPDWRWMLERTDSPWYPTVRLFRQPAPGDWDSVFAAVNISLDRYLS